MEPPQNAHGGDQRQLAGSPAAGLPVYHRASAGFMPSARSDGTVWNAGQPSRRRVEMHSLAGPVSLMWHGRARMNATAISGPPPRITVAPRQGGETLLRGLALPKLSRPARPVPSMHTIPSDPVLAGTMCAAMRADAIRWTAQSRRSTLKTMFRRSPGLRYYPRLAHLNGHTSAWGAAALCAPPGSRP